MLRHLGSAGSCLLLALALSGCPMTDGYFIDAGGAASSVAGTQSAGAGSGGAAAGSALADQGGRQGAKGGMSGGGEKPLLSGGNGNAGSAATCVAATERCNGHDDNCNDVVDEQACNSKANGTLGCAGFVIASRPDHGYMLCTTIPRSYDEAQAACEQQSMRLAWLESDAENREVSMKVHALTNDEVSFGATDAAVEGDWRWDGPGGAQFWRGPADGAPYQGAFDAWAPGTPNDAMGGEDCAVLNAATGLWGDRACSVQFAYLCEEPEP